MPTGGCRRGRGRRSSSRSASASRKCRQRTRSATPQGEAPDTGASAGLARLRRGRRDLSPPAVHNETSLNEAEAATSAHRARLELRLNARERVDGPTRDELSRPARAYLAAVVVAAVAAALATVVAPSPDLGDWLTFAGLAVAAAVAQHFIISTGRHQAFPLSIVFLIAAALLLPPQLVALLGVAHHVPELARTRFRRHITVFNVANYTVAALAAWGAA